MRMKGKTYGINFLIISHLRLNIFSQTASLTPSPSFAHNLGCKCANDQCEAIFDIYALRPFQWHQEHLNARCFGPCYGTLKIRESRRTPFPTFGNVTCTFTLSPKVGLRHSPSLEEKVMSSLTHKLFPLYNCFLLDPWPFANFAAWTLSQANLGVLKFPTFFWQVQEGLVGNPLPMLRQKRTKLS
jgi:hypothetical protein